MPTVLITGATKGIGLEFATQYARAGWRVIPTYRGDGSPALDGLNREFANVTPERLDMTDLAGIEALANKLSDVSIDVLLNNAGRMGGEGGPAAQTGEQFGTLDYALLDQYVHTNVRGPIKMAEAFVEHVKRSDQKKIVTISSGAGSFGVSTILPGVYWYKMSKAAVNMVMRNAARDLKPHGVTVLIFHPGLVITERLAPMRDMIIKMSGQEQAFEPHEAVGGMINAIANATIEDSGRFLTNKGVDMPW